MGGAKKKGGGSKKMGALFDLGPHFFYCIIYDTVKVSKFDIYFIYNIFENNYGK